MLSTVFGESLGTEINWTWAFSFLGALVFLGLVTLIFKSHIAGLFRGKDGRTSTSKTQLLLWTYVIVFALLTLLVGNVIVEVGDVASKSKDFDELRKHVAVPFATFVEKGLDPTYFILLGLPLGGAVAAKAITTTKVSEGKVLKPPKKDVPASQRTNPVAEIVTDDDASSDIGDFQYFLFNLVALGYFLSQFLIHPAQGLPVMPDTLVALTSVSAAGYIAKKGLYRDPPVLLSVSPPAAAPGDPVEIFGSRLLGRLPNRGVSREDLRRSVSVQFGRSVAEPVADATLELTPEHFTVEVPLHLEAGATTVKVVRPPGAVSEELPFEVVRTKPKIESVVPSVVTQGVEAQLVISGFGFTDPTGSSTDLKAVTLGGHRLTAANWQAGHVTATVPANLAIAAGTHPLVVHDARGRPSESVTVTVS